MAIQLKRVYAAAEANDGYRILVDRLWPRGVSKELAQVDCWLKEIAPSTALRQWFGHDPAKWLEFRQRYFFELDSKPQLVEELKAQVSRGKVTLLYGAKDMEHNDAVAIQRVISGAPPKTYKA